MSCEHTLLKKGKRQEARGKRQEARVNQLFLLFPIPYSLFPDPLFPVPLINYYEKTIISNCDLINVLPAIRGSLIKFCCDHSQFPIPDSRFPIPDSRFPIPDSRFPIPDSRFPIPDSRFSRTTSPTPL
ncbi:hypothetical protein [Moorena sp. SIOASIH]|uniref:hypothetical protein n=1 Tax=Moorena sp. SIOASIH TaxID=2607817 RepID=UPI0025EC2289|nr:hypothetical protein [Moorena sp. SIOASIH]